MKRGCNGINRKDSDDRKRGIGRMKIFRIKSSDLHNQIKSPIVIP